MTYKPAHLPAIIDFWNRTFQGCRNFFPIDDELFAERVLRVDTPIERFEPDGLLLALASEGQVLGLAHGGHRSEAAAKALNPGWPGGSQPYIALVAVDPDHRRSGIGRTLMRSVLGYLGPTHRPPLDGQCVSPYYGNALAPYQPFWGTTEGVSVDWDDAGTRAFLSSQGYTARYMAISLELTLAGANITPRRELTAGHSLIHCQSHCPGLGGYPEDGIGYEPGHPFWTHVYLIDGRVAGTLVSYEMSRLERPKWAIYELKVQERRRGQGIGSQLQATLINDLLQSGAPSIEVLTVPKLSPGAQQFYEKFGFQVTARWAIY